MTTQKAVFAIADNTPGKDGKMVFWWKTGSSFTPKKTWKTYKGAYNGLKALAENCGNTFLKACSIVLVNQEPRTAEEIIKTLRNPTGGFTSSPGDIMRVMNTPNMISDSISIRLTNAADGTDAQFCIMNKLESWKWLKSINELGNRQVIMDYSRYDDRDDVSYEKSIPYLCRFDRAEYRRVTGDCA